MFKVLSAVVLLLFLQVQQTPAADAVLRQAQRAIQRRKWNNALDKIRFAKKLDPELSFGEDLISKLKGFKKISSVLKKIEDAKRPSPDSGISSVQEDPMWEEWEMVRDALGKEDGEKYVNAVCVQLNLNHELLVREAKGIERPLSREKKEKLLKAEETVQELTQKVDDMPFEPTVQT